MSDDTNKCEIIENVANHKHFLYCRTHKEEAISRDYCIVVERPLFAQNENEESEKAVSLDLSDPHFWYLTSNKTDTNSKLKVITYDDIKALRPFYDLEEFIPKDWKGTALDILSLKKLGHHNKLWWIIMSGSISEKTMRLFNTWCGREALKLIDNPDPIFVKALDIVEAYANGKATAMDLLEVSRRTFDTLKSVPIDCYFLYCLANCATYSDVEDSTFSAAGGLCDLATIHEVEKYEAGKNIDKDNLCYATYIENKIKSEQIHVLTRLIMAEEQEG